MPSSSACPVAAAAGTLHLTAGLGRPLVLTNLEQPEALRLLGGGRRALGIAAGVLLAAGAFAVIAGAVLGRHRSAHMTRRLTTIVTAIAAAATMTLAIASNRPCGDPHARGRRRGSAQLR